MMQKFQYPHIEFVGCYSCRLLHPLAPEPGPNASDAEQAACDAHREFIAVHANHATASLVRHGEATCATGPLWDPLATLSFAVTDGIDCFVVTASRTSIEEPRTYRFAAGTLTATEAVVTIEDHALRRGLDHELFPHALRPSTVDHFVGVVREVVDRIDAEDLEIAFDDADDPAVSIAPMPEASYRDLLTRCASIFDEFELTRVRRFLAANRDEGGLLALRVRQDYQHLPA